MPAYENIMVTVTIFLFVTNAMFMFASALPGVEDGSNTPINMGVSKKDLNDMNNKIYTVLNAGNVFVPKNTDINAALTVTGQQKGYLTIFQEWLFGAADAATLGLSSTVIESATILGTIITLFGATFFGYMFWIDFFLPPAFPPAAYLGFIFKVFFFIVQALWLFQIVWQIFFAGTGTRG